MELRRPVKHRCRETVLGRGVPEAR